MGCLSSDPWPSTASTWIFTLLLWIWCPPILDLGALQVAAGWLSQDADSLSPEEVTFTVVSEAKPTAQQLDDIKFAWR